jgi:peptidoglycan/LPS O-acetylase OafA/YrhL
LLAAVFLGARFVMGDCGQGVLPAARQFTYTTLGLGGIGLLTMAAFVVQFRYPLPYRRFPLSWIRNFGQMGYLFYLVHVPVTKLFTIVGFAFLLRRWPGGEGVWAALPVCFALAAGVSAILFRTVERPIQIYSRPRPVQLARG